MLDELPNREGSPILSSAWERENVVALARRIRTLRIDRRIRIKDLIIGSGLIREAEYKGDKLKQQKFSRWINNAELGNKWKLLSETDYRKILSYIFSDKALWSTGESVTLVDKIFPDVVFHGVADWISMDANSINDVRENFTGSYTVYRHSLIKQRFVLVGHLNVYYEDNTRAVKTEENYKVIDSPAVDFRLQGYIFRRNGKFRILSKHVGQDEMQYIYIGAVLRRGGVIKSRQVLSMSGVVGDIQAETYYCTRIVFERDTRGDDSDGLSYSHNKCDYEKLTTVPVDAETIPERVQHILNNRPALTKDRYIVTFT